MAEPIDTNAAADRVLADYKAMNARAKEIARDPTLDVTQLRHGMDLGFGRAHALVKLGLLTAPDSFHYVGRTPLGDAVVAACTIIGRFGSDEGKCAHCHGQGWLWYPTNKCAACNGSGHARWLAAVLAEPTVDHAG